MKTDLYTKVILTVIAIFLGVLIFQNTSVIPTAKAGTAVTAQTPIPTTPQAAPVDVNISHLGGVPITNYRPPFRGLSGDIIPRKDLYIEEFNLYNSGLPVEIMNK